MEKSTVEQIPPEDDIPKAATNTGDDGPNIPAAISKALQRITNKDLEINRKTVFAHVSWKQLNPEEKEACQKYINLMEA